jgi:GT2 family glycosyltransferase
MRTFAVLVLYNTQLADSPTYRAIQDALRNKPVLAEQLQLLVFDNSPSPHAPSEGALGEYRHDGTNPGLASRYNQALAEAAAHGATWLMLLDQDTALTPEYFDQVETLSQSLAPETHIAGIIPKLAAGPRLLSPHIPCFRKSPYRLHLGVSGLLGGLLRAFNSGALLRVSALQAIGGFPEQYWLDYLDHATFHRLQAQGGQIWVMDVLVEHDLSIHRPEKHSDPANAARHRNQLRAEALFYREHGTPSERIRHQLNLLQRAFQSLLGAHLAEAWRLLQAARVSRLGGRP